MKNKYTKEQLENVVKDSRSLREVLIKVGLVGKGGNYEILKARLKDFEIDISHFTGSAWRKNNSYPTEKKKLEEILINNSKYKSGSPYQSNAVKRLLFKNNIKKKQCENCLIENWLEKKIIFELHHKDGDKYNNELSNLQILCPNCHSITNNFRGKNMNK